MAINHLGFDHYTIAVSDLVRSISFYRDIMGFEMIERPAFDFAGAWFFIGQGQQIHLIESDQNNVLLSGSRSLHFAFRVDDIMTVKNYLISAGVTICKDIKIRPDGYKQLFIYDPDGYVVELVENSNILRK